MRRRTDYLVLDLETVPDVSRWIRPETPHGVEAPFPPAWAHRVVVVGCLWLDADLRLKRLGVIGDSPVRDDLDVSAGASPDDADRAEAERLEALSRFLGRRRAALVTYNGRAFDLPVIALRSLCHGVPLPWYYQERGVRYRYSEEGHIDLCDWLADHGAARSASLDAVARLCGLPGKVGVDGSQVEGLFRAGQIAAIERYCLADVAQTAFVFLRFRLLQGVLSAAAYRDAVAALLDALAADERVAEVVARIDRAHLLSARGPALRPPEEPGAAAPGHDHPPRLDEDADDADPPDA
jgi:hypothetical protein